MGHGAAFILQNYIVVKTLKQSVLGTTELVLGQNQKVYVRKCLFNAAYPVEAVRGLKQRNLSHIIHAVRSEDKTYLIEEYFEGETLDNVLKSKGYLDEQRVIFIAEQVCEALSYLHQHNLVHRDVKPANILLQSNGHIRLIDLGSARLCSAREAGDTVVIGTQGYAAPEQYGLQSTDFRADVYALGVTMKELLGAGYEGRLNDVIDGCTRFIRGYRYDSIANVKRALFFAKYHRSLRMGLLGLLVAALGVCAFFYLRPAPEGAAPTPKAVEKTVPTTPALDKQKQEVESPKATEAPEVNQEPVAPKEQAAEKISSKASLEKKMTPQPQARLQLDIKGFNLSFNKIFGHPSDKELIDEAQSKGAWPISTNSSAALPYWEIIYKGDLINPIFTFQFQGIAFKGTNMQYGDSLSQKSWSVDNPNGWSTTVRLAETGRGQGPHKIYLVNVHKWFWFTNVAKPYVTVTVQADNVETTTKEYPINILDL